jgi:hypothetical protein
MPFDTNRSVQRRTVAVIAIHVAIYGFFIAYLGHSNIAYALTTHNAELGVALGQLARAESAQTPEGVIHHVTVAKAILPESGSVFWWSPEKVNFESIQAELDDLVSRARNISSLELGDELFNSEMLGIHARLKAIQETLAL